MVESTLIVQSISPAASARACNEARIWAQSLNQLPETSSVIDHQHAETSTPTKHGLA